MLALQAGVVAAPREVTRPRMLDRFTGRWWALVPVGSIVAVIFAIRYASGTATGLTYLALVAVPLLAAAALAWAARGPGRWLGRCLGGAVCSPSPGPIGASLVGQGAATLLSALSCVTLGVLLAAVTPPRWLKLGIIAMAAADAWLVASDLLQRPTPRWSRAAARRRAARGSRASCSARVDGLRRPVRGRRCWGRSWPAKAAAQWPAALLTLRLAGAVRPAVLRPQRAARDGARGRWR